MKKYADVLLDLAAERLVIYPFSILLLISFLFWHVTAVGLQPSRIKPDRLSYLIRSLHAHFISLVAAAIKPTNRFNTLYHIMHKVGYQSWALKAQFAQI